MPVNWMKADYNTVRAMALPVGKDADQSDLYVGRAFFKGDLLPAKVIVNRRQAYVSHGGLEHEVHDFEILATSTFSWREASNGKVPSNAVVGGRCNNGERLYIGRVQHAGNFVPGKIHPSQHCCYIPFGGKELSFQDYEVMIV